MSGVTHLVVWTCLFLWALACVVQTILSDRAQANSKHDGRLFARLLLLTNLMLLATKVLKLPAPDLNVIIILCNVIGSFRWRASHGLRINIVGKMRAGLLST